MFKCTHTFTKLISTTMPWNNRDYIQLGLLICCIPLQLYFTKYYKPENFDLLLVEFKNYLLTLEMLPNELFNLGNDLYSWLLTSVFERYEDADESPAVEVLEYKKKHGFDKQKARRIHNTRPEGLRYRVGQVVEHMYKDFRGVIVEWQFDPEKSDTPIYKILVDEKVISDDLSIQEVEQGVLRLLKFTQISNRFIQNYFFAFDGTQYLPQPWLKQLYPKD